VRRGVDLATRSTFADLGQTIADLFDVGPLPNGTSFRRELFFDSVKGSDVTRREYAQEQGRREDEYTCD
jgi:hypothetical protein